MTMSINLESGSSYWAAVIAVSLLKLLLINSYRSTDFEVHRNWMAITHSLPLEQWYHEKTSEWTLDYPPFFAYFEWILSQAAKYFDPEMLKVSNLNYASFNTILFQKLTVIVGDILLAYSILVCSRVSSVLELGSKSESSPSRARASTSKSGSARTQLSAMFVLIFLNGGLFMVDQIHFQYNGFLFGILLLAIAKLLEGKYYQGAFIFATLINFKHIFLYMAPAVGVFLLRKQCFPLDTPEEPKRILTSIGSFALVGISVLVASFGPFYKHIPQILSRLFPFQRGLSHAYWAPNVWALYNTLDWICVRVFGGNRSPFTSGLVGDKQFSFLPEILPAHTLVVTAFFMIPVLIKIWISPTEKNLVLGVTATAWTSFMFGYHVHEKAILNVLIPLSLVALQEPRLYFMVLVPGTVSLFPLLFTPFEIVLKAVIAILHFALALQVLPKTKFNRAELLYLVGFVGVYLFENLGPVHLPQLPFLPLILVSDYTFLGILYSYWLLYSNFAHLPRMDVKGKLKEVLDRRSEKETGKGTILTSEDELDSPGASPKKTRAKTATPTKAKTKTATPPASPPRRVLRKRTK